MLRSLLSNRGILVGLVFFGVIVGGSLIYSWHIHRTTDAELAHTQRTGPTLENKNEIRTTQDLGIPTDVQTLGETQTSIFSDDMPEAAPVAQDEQPITNASLVKENSTDPDFEYLPEESQIIRESRFWIWSLPRDTRGLS